MWCSDCKLSGASDLIIISALIKCSDKVSIGSTEQLHLKSIGPRSIGGNCLRGRGLNHMHCIAKCALKPACSLRVGQHWSITSQGHQQIWLQVPVWGLSAVVGNWRIKSFPYPVLLEAACSYLSSPSSLLPSERTTHASCSTPICLVLHPDASETEQNAFRIIELVNTNFSLELHRSHIYNSLFSHKQKINILIPGFNFWRDFPLNLVKFFCIFRL